MHLGVTGEDLVREMIPDADQRVVLIDGLGFGHANVVVAVPQAWIDVRSMADLDDVATAFRLRHDRKMRVATKYVNLTRDFFAEHGIVDYRIVESSGATEGAPAAGTAELIVDITTTGATLAANALKVVDDGVILRSQANLVASRGAHWGDAERETARSILDRIAAQARARAYREVRTRFPGCNDALLGEIAQPVRRGDAVRRADLVGHADAALPAAAQVHALASLLREKGAESIVVAEIDYVFAPDNPLLRQAGRRAEGLTLARLREALRLARGTPRNATARNSPGSSPRSRKPWQPRVRAGIGNQPRHQTDRGDQHRGVGDQAGEAGGEERAVGRASAARRRIRGRR